MGVAKTPKKPKIDTPVVENPGRAVDQAAITDLEERKRVAAQYSARASTLATGGQGAKGTATVGTKSLLGG